MPISLKCACVCVCVFQLMLMRESRALSSTALRVEGVLIIPALEQLDPLLLTLTRLTSEVWLWQGQSCFVREITEFCLSEDSFVWLQIRSINTSELTQFSGVFPVLTFEYCVSIQYLEPEHWRSCSELQPEHKQRKEQSDSKADRRRREGEKAQRGKQLEQS